MVASERPKSVVDALEVLGTPRSTWNRLRGTFALTDTRIQNAQSILNDETFDSALWQTVLDGYDVNTSDDAIGSLYDRQQGLCETAENYERLDAFLDQYKKKAASLSPDARNELEKDVGITFHQDGSVNLETVLKFLKDGNSLDTNRFDEFSEAYATEHGGSFDTRKTNIQRQLFGKYWANIEKTFAPFGALINSQSYVNNVVQQGGRGATLVNKYRGQRQWWAIGLTALGVAAAIATGGASLGFIALATGASVATSAAVNSHRINQIHQVAALRNKETRAYVAEKTAYIHGNSPGRQAALENADLVFTVNDVHQDKFITAKTAVNLATGRVMLGGMAEKYAGLVDAYFVDSSGTFDIIPTQKAIGTMGTDQIKAMVEDILAKSNLDHRLGDVTFKAGGASHKFSDKVDFVSLAKDAQLAKERVEQEARLAAEQKALKNSLDKALKNLNAEKLDEILIRAYTEGANTDSKLLEITASVLASDSGLDSSRITQVLNENKTLGNSVVESLNQRVRDNFNINGNVAPTTWSCNQVASAFSGKQDATKSEILVSLAKSSEDLSPNSVAMVAAMVSVGMNPQDIDKFKAAVDEINTKINSGNNFSLTENTLSVITTLQSKNSYEDLNAVIGAIYQGNSSLPSEEQSNTPSEEQIFTNTWANRGEAALSA